MRTNGITIFSAGVLLIIGLTQGIATADITPISATTAAPIGYAYPPYNSSLANVIDGVPNYNNGGWVSLGPEGQGTWAGPYTVAFGLGAAYNLTGFNLWNNAGNIEMDGEGVNGFTLTFYDPSMATVGSFNGTATDLLAMQTFAFTASNVQTVDFKILSSHFENANPDRRYAMFYEASFEGAVVPLPGAVLLGAVGMSVAGWRLRRQKS